MRKPLISILFLLLATASVAQVEIFHGTLEEGLAQAEREGKRVVVMVSASWCAPCRMMMEKVLPTREAGDYVNPRYLFLKCIADVDDPDKIAETYNVKVFPTFLFLDGEGRETVRHVGAMRDAREMQSVMEHIMDDPILELKRNYGLDPQQYGVEYARCLRARDDYSTLSGVLENLFRIMERKTFYTAFREYLTGGVVELGDGITEGILQDSLTFCSILGTGNYMRIAQQWASTKNWALVLEGVQPPHVQALASLLNRYPSMRNPSSRFIFLHINLFRAKNTAALLDEIAAAAPQLPPSDLIELYCLTVRQCRKSDLSALECRFRTLAKQLNESMADPNHIDLVEYFEMMQAREFPTPLPFPSSF